MASTALVRGAAVSAVVAGVLAVGAAPAYAWYTTGPNGETICEFGGSYPDCNTEPTAGSSTGGGGAVESPAPVETSTSVESSTPTPAPSSSSAATVTNAGSGTGSGGGSATGATSTTSTVTGGTGSVGRPATAAAATNGGLPFTGFEAGAAAAIGLAALGVGSVLLVGSRRRSSKSAASA